MFNDNHKGKKGDATFSVLEFFSGIGGMRSALQSTVENASFYAFDISLYANATYRHNFDEEARTKLVEQLKSEELDRLEANLWTLSPPCQPFTRTRGAKMLDDKDKRCNGLKALMDLLTNVKLKPNYILLENVKGFASSRMVQHWKKCLAANEYGWQEFLLSPIQLGIPNHRQRYYMLCEHRSKRWVQDSEIQTQLPGSETIRNHTKKISVYVDSSLPAQATDFIVSREVLKKDWAKELGVVTVADTATHCFTAGYGRIFHRSTGSLLLMGEAEAVAAKELDRSDMTKYYGRLRRFTPQELLRIFGFPDDFSFPDYLNSEQQYKLVGNSINVTLVAELMKVLIHR